MVKVRWHEIRNTSVVILIFAAPFLYLGLLAYGQLSFCFKHFPAEKVACVVSPGRYKFDGDK